MVNKTLDVMIVVFSLALAMPATVASAPVPSDAVNGQELALPVQGMEPLAPATAPVAATVKTRDLESLRTTQIQVARIRILPRNFNDVSSMAWTPDGRRLLVDRMQRRTYKVVEITLPDTFRDDEFLPERELISRKTSASRLLHCGSPAWYPGSDRFFAYVDQIANSRDFTGGVPWNGLHCNLMVCDKSSGLSVPLTRFRYSLLNPRGSTAPRFSPDGKMLSWSGPSMTRRDDSGSSLWGNRSLFLGQFSWGSSVPTLVNMREVRDASLGSYYENNGFTPDGKQLIFSASRANQAWFDMDILSFDLKTGKTRNLTAGVGGWNRWASMSPKGYKITWSSSKSLTNANLGIGGTRWQQELRTDLWIMNPDGSDKRRLTYFNTLDSHDNQTLRMTPYEHCYVGHSAWHPNGRQIVAVICFGTRRTGNAIGVLLDLSEVGVR